MAYDRLCIIDDEARRFTAKVADSTAISGGFLVKWTSGTDCVGSNVSTYDWNDISVSACDSADNCVGIALDTTASGNEVAVAMQGVFILPAGSEAISGGWPVHASGYGNMAQLIVMNRAVGSGAQYMPIGRALSTATALTGYAIVRLSV